MILNQRLNRNLKSLTVAPSVLRQDSADASPRLLAGGFNDEETNLVREESGESGDTTLSEVEGSSGGGEMLIMDFKALAKLSNI